MRRGTTTACHAPPPARPANEGSRIARGRSRRTAIPSRSGRTGVNRSSTRGPCPGTSSSGRLASGQTVANASSIAPASNAIGNGRPESEADFSALCDGGRPAPGPYHRDIGGHTRTLPAQGTPRELTPQQPPVAADRARLGGILCRHTAAVNWHVARPDQRGCYFAAQARWRPARALAEPITGGAGPGLGSDGAILARRELGARPVARAPSAPGGRLHGTLEIFGPPSAESTWATGE